MVHRSSIVIVCCFCYLLLANIIPNSATCKCWLFPPIFDFPAIFLKLNAFCTSESVECFPPHWREESCAKWREMDGWTREIRTMTMNHEPHGHERLGATSRCQCRRNHHPSRRYHGTLLRHLFCHSSLVATG